MSIHDKHSWLAEFTQNDTKTTCNVLLRVYSTELGYFVTVNLFSTDLKVARKRLTALSLQWWAKFTAEDIEDAMNELKYYFGGRDRHKIQSVVRSNG